ncbi:MAG: sulfatase-like hydrolase/transferase [Spirochaetales bacterium]|nr:sulfatase-like hydrolase/transferase [Spirochaetales bacterium]
MKKRKDNAPNIVLITADQLRWDYVGAYGNGWIKTPNIDSIATEGCICERAYSPNPVCIPARYNLITGLTAKHHGFDDNYFGPQAKPCPYYLPTFAQILSDAGYATAAIGKMHFQPERRATGFDMFLNCDEVVYDVSEDDYARFLVEKGYGDIGSIHGVRNILYMQPQQSLLPEELHGSSWVGDKSAEYIRNRVTRDRPFLLWAGFIAPHPPLDVPHSWAHMYDGKVPPHTVNKTPLCKIAEENKTNAFLPGEVEINRMRETYAASVSFMDHNVGKILRAIDESGLKDNTLVVFVSDHGEMLGDLNTYQKFLAYDASMRIPMLLRWPGHIEKGSSFKGFADLNDLLPTFLDVSGTDYPADYELPGESLFSKEPKKDRTVQYGEYQHGSKRWCVLMDRRYKFVHHYGDIEELFDLEKDPDETTNMLYGNPEKEILEIRARLKERLLEYEFKCGLPGHIENGEFVQFPPYEIVPRREGIFPTVRKKDLNDPSFRPIQEDILQAISDEPLVKIDNLVPDLVLKNYGGLNYNEIRDFKHKAKILGH